MKDVEKASNASQSKDSLATIASGFQGINSALQMAIDDVSRGPSPVIAARGSSTHPDPECSVCDPLTTIVSVVLGTVADWLRGVIQVLQFAEEDAAQIVGDALKTVYLALKLTLITIQRGIFIIPVALIQLVCGLVGTIVHIILSCKFPHMSSVLPHQALTCMLATGLLECVKEVGGTIIHDLIDLLGEIVHVFPLIGDFVASIIDSLHHLEN